MSGWYGGDPSSYYHQYYQNYYYQQQFQNYPAYHPPSGPSGSSAGFPIQRPPTQPHFEPQPPPSHQQGNQRERNEQRSPSRGGSPQRPPAHTDAPEPSPKRPNSANAQNNNNTSNTSNKQTKSKKDKGKAKAGPPENPQRPPTPASVSTISSQKPSPPGSSADRRKENTKTKNNRRENQNEGTNSGQRSPSNNTVSSSNAVPSSDTVPSSNAVPSAGPGDGSAEWIPEFLEQRRSELAAEKIYVSAQRLLRDLREHRNVKGPSSLGFDQWTDIPFISEHMKLEKDVSSFLNIHLNVREVSTIFSVEEELCAHFKVQDYAELKLGPLVKHPVIKLNFKPAADLVTTPPITIAECVEAFVELLKDKTEGTPWSSPKMSKKAKRAKIEAFLNHMAKKHGSNPDRLGIRVKDPKGFYDMINRLLEHRDQWWTQVVQGAYVVKETDAAVDMMMYGSSPTWKQLVKRLVEQEIENGANLDPNAPVTYKKLAEVDERCRQFAEDWAKYCGDMTIAQAVSYMAGIYDSNKHAAVLILLAEFFIYITVKCPHIVDRVDAVLPPLNSSDASHLTHWTNQTLRGNWKFEDLQRYYSAQEMVKQCATMSDNALGSRVTLVHLACRCLLASLIPEVTFDVHELNGKAGIPKPGSRQLKKAILKAAGDVNVLLNKKSGEPTPTSTATSTKSSLTLLDVKNKVEERYGNRHFHKLAQGNSFVEFVAKHIPRIDISVRLKRSPANGEPDDVESTAASAAAGDADGSDRLDEEEEDGDGPATGNTNDSRRPMDPKLGAAELTSLIRTSLTDVISRTQGNSQSMLALLLEIEHDVVKRFVQSKVISAGRKALNESDMEMDPAPGNIPPSPSTFEEFEFSRFGHGSFLSFVNNYMTEEIEKAFDPVNNGKMGALTRPIRRLSWDDISAFLDQCLLALGITAQEALANKLPSNGEDIAADLKGGDAAVDGEPHTLSPTLCAAVERSLCDQFGLNQLDELGFGKVEAVCLRYLREKQVEKEGVKGDGMMMSSARTSSQVPVMYEYALVCDTSVTGLENRRRASSNGKTVGDSNGNDSSMLQTATTIDVPQAVGKLGWIDASEAWTWIERAPLMVDLHKWLHWPTVFEPMHGRLRDFVKTSEGRGYVGDREGEVDIMMLELSPHGDLVRVPSRSNFFTFREAVESGKPVDVVAHLLSILIQHGGISNCPLSLLASHVLDALGTRLQQARKQELLFKVTTSSDGSTNTISSNTRRVDFVVARFVKEVLVVAPPSMRSSLVWKVLVKPFTQLVPQAYQALLDVASGESSNDVGVIHQLGLEMGVDEWINDLTRSVKSGVAVAAEKTTPTKATDGNTKAPVAHEAASHATSHLSTPRDSAVAYAKSSSNGSSNQQQPMDTTSDDPGYDAEKEAVPSMTVEECRAVVEEIRREEFGFGVDLGSHGNRVLDVQLSRNSRALQRLSHELYTKDTHFVLELLQNADDNKYPRGIKPTIKFHISEDCIVVGNNEVGFSVANIRALCDIGKSTKSAKEAGYIGQKGIGFKAVFRVSKVPQVHSRGFHIEFNSDSFIIPEWREEDNDVVTKLNHNQGAPVSWTTKIVLPLSDEVKGKGLWRLLNQFGEIRPSLLLFLHKIEHLVIEDTINNTRREMIRVVRDNGEVDIYYNGQLSRWLVVKRLLDSAQAKSAGKTNVIKREGAEVTELAVAFPLDYLKENSMEVDVDFKTWVPPQQHAFAYLPLRGYGFKFVIQGDFVVPSSREDLDRDSPWNEWLRSELPSLFVHAFEIHRNRWGTANLHSDAVAQHLTIFFRFLPSEGETTGFFKPITRGIVDEMRHSRCVLDSTGQWVLPSQVVGDVKHDVQKVVPATLLKELLGLHYMHPALNLNPVTKSALGIRSFTSADLTCIMDIIIRRPGGLEAHLRTDPSWLKNWLACVYQYINDAKTHHGVGAGSAGSAAVVAKTLERLKRMTILPLSRSKKFTAVADGPLFFRTSEEKKGSGSAETAFGGDGRYTFINDLREVDIDVLLAGSVTVSKTDADYDHLDSVEDDVKTSMVKSLLMMMGVKSTTGHEITHHHVLPAIRNFHRRESNGEKQMDVFVGYINFLKEHAAVCSTCMDDEKGFWDVIRTKAYIATTKGYVLLGRSDDGGDNGSDECRVHYSSAYGNDSALDHLPWNKLSDVYLTVSGGSNAVTRFKNLPQLSRPSVQAWRTFFDRLGVTDFFQIASRSVVVHGGGSDFGFEPDTDVEIRDWICFEFPSVICECVDMVEKCQPRDGASTMTAKEEKSVSAVMEALNHLATVFDSRWADQYARCAVGTIAVLAEDADGADMDEDGKSPPTSLTVPSTFARMLQELNWLPTTKGMYRPRDVYMKLPELVDVFGDVVPYVTASINEDDFAEMLGVKMEPTVEDVVALFNTWLNSGPTAIRLSLEDALALYSVLEAALGSEGLREWAQQDHAVVFVPLNKEEGTDLDQVVQNNRLKSRTRKMDDNRLALGTGTSKFSGVLVKSRQCVWMNPVASVNSYQRNQDETVYVLDGFYANVKGEAEKIFSGMGIPGRPRYDDYVDMIKEPVRYTPITETSFRQAVEILSAWSSELADCPAETMLQIRKSYRDSRILPTNRQVAVSANTPGVYINDDPTSASKFSSTPQIRFVGCYSPAEATPESLLPLLDALAIPRLSKRVRAEPIALGALPALHVMHVMRENLVYAQQYMVHHHPDVYERLKRSGIAEKLRGIRVQVAETLSVIYTLDGVQSRPVSVNCYLDDPSAHPETSAGVASCTTFDGEQPVSFLVNLRSHGIIMDENVGEAATKSPQTVSMYVTKEFMGHLDVIFKEMTRVFFNGDINEDLANFLHVCVLMSATEISAEGYLERRGIPPLPQAEFPLWVLDMEGYEVPVEKTPEEEEMEDETNLLEFWEDTTRAGEEQFVPLNQTREVLGDGQSHGVKRTIADRADDMDSGQPSLKRQRVGNEMGSRAAGEQNSQNSTVAKPLVRSYGSAARRGSFVGKWHIISFEYPIQLFVRSNMKPDNPFDVNELTGLLGEEAVFLRLNDVYANDPERRVQWVNQAAETGAPYDLIVYRRRRLGSLGPTAELPPASHGISPLVSDGRYEWEAEEYVEVKSTACQRKMVFEMSLRELKFAEEKGSRYTVYRVFNVVRKAENRLLNFDLMTLNNPTALARQRKIQLQVTMKGYV
ncbi:hypothetical protein HK102_003386 [Quaeritorhiza haematococci]|nr:hypothetical protein HK102_003386 [Quaeritorhiza haematococci]